MKTRILAIVPYNGIKEIMNELVENDKDIELTVHVGTLQHGLKIVQSYNLDDFDIIIARGGTADLIEKHVNIPVVRIEISVYDILRAIKLAENSTSHYAIVGVLSTIENAILLRNLLQYDIRIVELEKVEDDRQAIIELLEEGYEMVLCDMRATQTAYELGMNYTLITSGRESIKAAFTQGINTARMYSFYRHQSRIFKNALTGSKETLFVFDSNRNLIYAGMTRNDDTEIYFQIIEQNIDAFYGDQAFRLEERTKNCLLSYYCNHTVIDDETYLCIYQQVQNIPAPIDDLGFLLYENTETMNSDFELNGSANLIGTTRKTLETYSRTRQPLLILGEVGTGKDKAVSFLYRHSEYKKHPLVIIDCANTNPKKWHYFMESPNSPLNDIHITIYIKNVQALHESVASKLLPYLNENDLCKRNRFLFSCSISSESDAQLFVCQYLMNSLFCMVLWLAPLRERTEDIPNIAALYINQANIELGKQVVGFEPRALELMQNFSWKHNLSQFKRIIHQLILLTDGDYISVELVKHMLKQETPKVTEYFQPGCEIVNTNQSLEDINYDIIRLVLDQENSNRSKAAERLKISRTTLWRILQRNT